MIEVNDTLNIHPITAESTLNARKARLVEAYHGVMHKLVDQELALIGAQSDLDNLPTGSRLTDKGKMAQGQMLQAQREIKNTKKILNFITDSLRRIAPELVEVENVEVDEEKSSVILQ